MISELENIECTRNSVDSAKKVTIMIIEVRDKSKDIP